MLVPVTGRPASWRLIRRASGHTPTLRCSRGRLCGFPVSTSLFPPRRQREPMQAALLRARSQEANPAPLSVSANAHGKRGEREPSVTLLQKRATGCSRPDAATCPGAAPPADAAGPPLLCTWVAEAGAGKTPCSFGVHDERGACMLTSGSGSCSRAGMLLQARETQVPAGAHS